MTKKYYVFGSNSNDEYFSKNPTFVGRHLRDNDKVESHNHPKPVHGTDNYNISHYSNMANLKYNSLPESLKCNNNILLSFNKGFLGQAIPLKNKRVIINTGTPNVVFEIDHSHDKFADKLGYDIEQALGLKKGRVHVFVKTELPSQSSSSSSSSSYSSSNGNRDTRDYKLLSSMKKRDFWNTNGNKIGNFVINISKNDNPRSFESLQVKKLTEDEKNEKSFEKYFGGISKEICSNIAKSIDGKNWFKSSEKFSNSNNLNFIVTRGIVNQKHYNKNSNYYKFLQSKGITYPNLLVTKISQNIAGKIDSMRNSKNIQKELSSCRSSSEIQNKIGYHLCNFMSACPVYNWFKCRYLLARKKARSYSCWKDKREDCSGRVKLSSSDDDMMADTDSSDDGLSDNSCSDSDSDSDSGSDSDSDSDDDNYHHHHIIEQHAYNDFAIKMKKPCKSEGFTGLFKDVVHDTSTLLKKAACAVTGGGFDGTKKSSLYYADPDPYGYAYLGKDIKSDCDSDRIGNKIESKIFMNHWTNNKKLIQSAFSKDKEYLIVFPHDGKAKYIDLDSPESIKYEIIKHSCVIPSNNRNINNARLKTLDGKNVVIISDNGKFVNGKPSSEPEILFDADTGYNILLKPSSIRFK